MQLRPLLCCLCAILFQLSSAAKPAKRHYKTHNYYVLEQPSNAVISLEDVAQELGVEVVEQAGALKNHWLVRSPKDSLDARTTDQSDPVIARYESLRSTARTSSIAKREKNIVSSILSLELQRLRQRVKRAPPPVRPGQQQGNDQPTEDSSARGVATRMGFQDPLFDKQWHLVNDQHPEHMMNVVPVWEMGYKGKGIITSLVDDGLDYTSEDLKDAFDADDSYDYNDHEELPYPKLGNDHHGTRCAGQIAARTNTACGVGIAYESKVAGVRILSGEITDVDEAAALNLGYQNVSIYSCSWGPTDDGQTMEAPDSLIKKAMVEGITNGRGGKGSIFVFASGNGAYAQDQCNFDGYTNSIFSITVSAVDHEGHHPSYSEPCTANMIVAYSSGGGKSITTTDKGENHCSSGHGGTSAAAPNAAGVFALALEARPDLSWRDMQYLCVQTAKQLNPDEDWEMTAIGRPYSNKYGYGALDAYEYVKLAKDWELVKPQTWFFTDTVQIDGGKMGEDEVFQGGQFIPEGGVKSTITVTEDQLKGANFEKLEHIYVKVWIQHSKRGDVEVEVVSPNGIRSVLAEPRHSDSASTGFPGWTFMTVKHWGEHAIGDWTIRVWDQNHPEEHNGTFLGWNMILYGSVIDPSNVRQWEVPTYDQLLPPGKPVEEGGEESHEEEPTTTESTPTATSVEETPEPTTEPGTPTSSASSSAPASPSSTSESSESLFGAVSDVTSRHPIAAGLIGAIFVTSIGAGVWLWRRRNSGRPSSDEYVSLPAEGGEGMPMTSVSRSQLSVNEPFRDDVDDEDADERTRLRNGPDQNDASVGVGFHDEFLDDEEANSPVPLTPQQQRYRDDPADE